MMAGKVNVRRTINPALKSILGDSHIRSRHRTSNFCLNFFHFWRAPNAGMHDPQRSVHQIYVTLSGDKKSDQSLFCITSQSKLPYENRRSIFKLCLESASKFNDR
jgi:hypothetical protein